MKKIIMMMVVLFFVSSVFGGPIQCLKKEYSSLCKVERLKVSEKTLSVKCNTGDSQADGHIKSMPYHAALLTQKNAGYMIDLIKTAKIQKRRIRIFYSCPADLNPKGCKKSNCRRLKGIGF